MSTVYFRKNSLSDVKVKNQENLFEVEAAAEKNSICLSLFGGYINQASDLNKTEQEIFLNCVYEAGELQE